MASRPDLAALLVAHKVAAARDVERTIRAASGQPVWRALIDAKLVTAAQIFELFRDLAKMPVASDKALQATPAVDVLARLVGKDEALRRGILPFEVSADGRRAQIAMIDPTDELALREVARAGALQGAKVFVAERATLITAIERAYGGRTRKDSRNSVEPAAKVGQRSELEAQERLERVLVQASLALGASLEMELVRGAMGRWGQSAVEAGRLAREIARELAYDRRRVALVGLATMMVQLDAVRRARRGDDDRTLFEMMNGEVGWAGGGDDGLLGIARALGAQAAGFGKQPPGGALQRVVQVVIDFLALGGPDDEAIDLDAAEQLIRTSSGGGPVVDALMRILRRDIAERTPAVATVLPEAQEGRTQVRPAPRRADANPDDRTQQVSIAQVVKATDVPRE